MLKDKGRNQYLFLGGSKHLFYTEQLIQREMHDKIYILSYPLIFIADMTPDKLKLMIASGSMTSCSCLFLLPFPAASKSNLNGLLLSSMSRFLTVFMFRYII